MPDGMGDDDNYGRPTLAQLKQMSWDLSYIRDKLTLGNVSKTLVWRRMRGTHQMVLGLIDYSHSTFLGALRGLASRIQSGSDGPAPAVQDFGESGWSQTQLAAMHEGLETISAKIMSGKRTLTMRMSGMAGSAVELGLGDIEAVHASYRSAIANLAEQIESGRG